MQTKIIKINSVADYPKMAEAAEMIKSGGLVAFPTETVYGLGANALDERASAAIFAAKGRPADNPLIVHIYDRRQLEQVVSEINPAAQAILDSFCPGPVTIIMKRAANIGNVITAGLDTVAVRMPSHPAAAEFLRQCGVPVAAPSANLSGKPSPTAAGHVAEDFFGKIPFIIDGGVCTVGLESTIVDTTEDVPKILRPGGITLGQLESVLGRVLCDPALADSSKPPKAPGMKYRHYAPAAELTVVTGECAADEARRLCSKAKAEKRRVGVLKCSRDELFGADFEICCGKTANEYAASLFSALRRMDELGAEVIFAELPFDGDGIEAAIKNRIFKAAGGRVIKC